MQPYQPPYPIHDDTPYTPTLDDDVSQQITGIMTPLPGSSTPGASSSRIKTLPIIAIALCLILAIVLYFVWHQQPDAAPPSTTLATTANNTSSSSSSSSTNTIQVYVVGQVKHPGIYTIASDARIYQAIQAAGGPLPGADLVTLNLATHVSDGQEIYVPRVGETVPTLTGTPGTSTTGTTPSSGALVNINTASATTLRQQLHVSSKTAQAIIAYRTQHGPYTSVSQLANAISKTIYNRIKNEITVS